MKKRSKFSGVHRENIKGKYFVVARSNGRMLEKIKWSPRANITNKKNISLDVKSASIKFKEDRSFKAFTKKTVLANVTETVSSRRPPNKKYQYYVRLRGKDFDITARSQTHPSSFPTRKAKDEAWESALERLHQERSGGYDADEGRKIFESETVSVSEGFVWYSRN